MEAWHRGLNEHIACKHPCLYRFLENIIEVQGTQECNIAKIEAGEEPERQRKIYRDYEDRLKQLVDRYKSDLKDDELALYVRSIASVLSFDVTVRKKHTQDQVDENEEME